MFRVYVFDVTGSTGLHSVVDNKDADMVFETEAEAWARIAELQLQSPADYYLVSKQKIPGELLVATKVPNADTP